jgi:hypothetical protein
MPSSRDIWKIEAEDARIPTDATATTPTALLMNVIIDCAPATFRA